ncbi:MBL fold metallo-hydrolase [Clostridium sp. 'White wine YQ']|uniref:MBL fold metallo-hydrolase n=1 Tax=Clostridium sp. 'White wine YQ' TaxID=3027474 RepID=UPI00236703DF|nr:MBL fold metallo-hydrolase [Clostridium sp. 'White wine YQ']MDD7793670.1 MBL fold metallo-hydrolase [Clostridium sp. 'White wine YQ']
MKLKVLGSGSSGNCYLLQNNEETLIIECGLQYKTILKGLDFNLSNVVGCLITHEHKDHSKAIRELLKDGIDVYTSLGTTRAILKECEAIETYHRLHFIKSENQFKVGRFTVLPFSTKHDAVEPLGFLIQHEKLGKLLFITDSYYCEYKFKNINHILIECNYSQDILEENLDNEIIHPVLRDRLIKSHFSLENVKEFLKANDLSVVNNVVLIHLSDSNSNAREFKSQIERLTGKPVYIANKGLEINLEL